MEGPVRCMPEVPNEGGRHQQVYSPVTISLEVKLGVGCLQAGGTADRAGAAGRCVAGLGLADSILRLT